MNTLLRLLPLLALAFVSLRAADAPAKASAPADNKVIAAVTAADNERVAATIAADRARLDAILSDALHYAHSSGKVDTKASYVHSVLSGGTTYISVYYDERTFTPIAPGVVLMSGRAAFKSAENGVPVSFYLGFLAVWREENGKWHFVAWQSLRLTPPGAPAAK